MTTFTEVKEGNPRHYRKTLDNSMQFIKKGILGFGTLALIGCTTTGKAFVQSTAYETLNYGIQRGIDQEVYRQQMERRNYQGPTGEDSVLNPQRIEFPEQRDYPIFFNAAKRFDGGYSDLRDIFYPGEEIYSVANLNTEGKITNFCLALDKNEQIPKDLVNGSDKIKIVLKGYLTPGNFARGKFDASYLLENYGNNFRTYWLLNDKIIGHRDFVIMDKKPESYSSNKRKIPDNPSF